MTNTIKSYICTTLADIISVMLDEAATDTMPYAVMELSTADGCTKAGVNKIAGTLTIVIYATDYSTVSTKGDAVMAALAPALRTVQYRGRLTDHRVECVDGIWQDTLSYSVAEYAVPAASTNNNN